MCECVYKFKNTATKKCCAVLAVSCRCELSCRLRLRKLTKKSLYKNCIVKCCATIQLSSKGGGFNYKSKQST